MELENSIYVAGHTGLVGSNLVQHLHSKGYENLVLRRSTELDLRNQIAVREFMLKNKPEYVFLAAAKVGGILSNKIYKAEFLYENLLIASNVIHSAYEAGVKKLLFIGTSSVYPKDAPQPYQESCLMSGRLDPSNEPYAIAKIAGIKLCEVYSNQYGVNFISVILPNLYGSGDNFDPVTSHVLPGLIRKFHEAKVQKKSHVTLWGNGEVFREFLHTEDACKAMLKIMLNYNSSEIINIGVGHDIMIKNLAIKIKNHVGYSGKITWDTTKPNGIKKKLMDNTKVKGLNWAAEIDIDTGIEKVYKEFLHSLTNTHSIN